LEISNRWTVRELLEVPSALFGKSPFAESTLVGKYYATRLKRHRSGLQLVGSIEATFLVLQSASEYRC
jgi:hypothetical protein